MPEGISKKDVVEAATSLGSRHALDAVYTLSELGFQAAPRTSLGKVRKQTLKDAVLKYRDMELSRQKVVNHVEKDDQTPTLLDSLAAVWEDLTGTRPSPQENVAYMADSITLLRYCDSVWRVLGKRLYFQDFLQHDSLEKQARLLQGIDTSHRVNTLGSNGVNGHERVLSSSTVADTQPILGSGELGMVNGDISKSPVDEKLLNARRLLDQIGLESSGIEDILVIRESLHRTVVGQRPHSYRLRMVFEVHKVQVDQLRLGIETCLASRPIFELQPVCLEKMTPSTLLSDPITSFLISSSASSMLRRSLRLKTYIKMIQQSCTPLHSCFIVILSTFENPVAFS